jgi:hypothetical protein
MSFQGTIVVSIYLEDARRQHDTQHMEKETSKSNVGGDRSSRAYTTLLKRARGAAVVLLYGGRTGDTDDLILLVVASSMAVPQDKINEKPIRTAGVPRILDCRSEALLFSDSSRDRLLVDY